MQNPQQTVAISKTVVDLVSAGVILLTLGQVFRFVKWVIEWIDARRNPKKDKNGDIPRVQTLIIVPESVKEALEKVEDALKGVTSGLSQVTLDLGVMSEKVRFMTKVQGEQNGDVRELMKRIEAMKDACGARMIGCMKRFREKEE